MNGKREYDLRDQERREQAANVRVGALCRVEKFDPAAMRVDVQPLSKALDAGVYRTQPQILSVPVALVRGGGFVLRPCYKAGDVGVLLYIDHDIDRIFQEPYVQEISSLSMTADGRALGVEFSGVLYNGETIRVEVNTGG